MTFVQYPYFEFLRRQKSGPGPIKWHKFCSRYHGSRESCNLVEVERKAKSGKTVKRLAHEEVSNG